MATESTESTETPLPSLTLGSPPPTRWIGNAEETTRQEVGGGEPQSGCGAGFPCFLCFPWLIWGGLGWVFVDRGR